MPTKAKTPLQRYAWLSIAAALATILLKGIAWKLTGSVGLLSDAIESFVNLAGALMALWMLTVAATPADSEHPYGHGKAEYFSSAFEGFLIVVAAGSIAYTAIERFITPRPLETIGLGLLVSVVASLINFVTSRILMRAGRENRSITLEADAQHLMTDVWTSVGVIVGVGLVAFSGWLWLDPAIALLVALNILWTGWHLMRRSVSGMMDASLPADDLQRVEATLRAYEAHGLSFHALRTRQAGSRTFINVHLLMPGNWSIQTGHDWSERVEEELRAILHDAHITTHIEPREDPRSMSDQELM